MTVMLTGICPGCKVRRLVVRHSVWLRDDETGETAHAGYKNVIRNHGCGCGLDPSDVMPVEDAYQELKDGDARRIRPSDHCKALERRRKVSL